MELLENLDRALKLQPDLATVMCGAGDLLQSPCLRIEDYKWTLADVLGLLRAGQPDISLVMATVPVHGTFNRFSKRNGPDPAAPLRQLNEAIREVCTGLSVPVLDIARLPRFLEERNFADRPFWSKRGHALVAAGIASLLRREFAMRLELPASPAIQVRNP